MTAGANASDGTAVSMISAVTHDVEYLVLGFMNFSSSGNNGSCMADVLIDPAGGTSWASLIDDLLIGETLTVGAAAPPALYYHFPIWIKSGTSIGMRAKTKHTSNITGRIVCFAFGGNANPATWWCGQRVTGIGLDATNCIGTNHTPGTSGTFSSWTDFGSTLAARAGAFQFAVQGTNTNTAQAAGGYFWEFGIGGERIGPTFLRDAHTVEAGWTMPPAPIFYDAPAGAQMQVRGTGPVSVDTFDVAAYAVS